MNWKDPKKELPSDLNPDGVPVIVNLKNDGKSRMYGDVVMSVYFKGKFHWNFKKGVIQKITHWHELPEPPI